MSWRKGQSKPCLSFLFLTCLVDTFIGQISHASGLLSPWPSLSFQRRLALRPGSSLLAGAGKKGALGDRRWSWSSCCLYIISSMIFNLYNIPFSPKWAKWGLFERLTFSGCARTPCAAPDHRWRRGPNRWGRLPGRRACAWTGGGVENQWKTGLKKVELSTSPTHSVVVLLLVYVNV